MKRKSRIIIPVTLALILLGAAPAHATLVGETISASSNHVNRPSATIGDGVEFTGLNGQLDFDFGGNSLTISKDDSTGWSNWQNIVFSGFEDRILDVSIVSNLGFQGTIVNNIRFTDHSITIDFSQGAGGCELVLAIRTVASEEAVVPTLNIRQAIELNWQSQAGVSYQIQHSTDMVTWFDDGEVIPGTDSELSVLRSKDSEKKYYRVAILEL